MRARAISAIDAYAAAFVLLAVVSCSPLPHSSRGSLVAVEPTPLILAVNEGEARTWRNWKDTRVFIKVDAQNGGSPDLVMGYEEIAPGLVIPTHRHLTADEIVFVYRGSGVAKVGEREEAFTEGATIYIPRNVRVTIRSTGTVPLAIAFIFSKPGMEGFIRDYSVPVGQSAPDLSPAEFARIGNSHRWHVIYDEP